MPRYVRINCEGVEQVHAGADCLGGTYATFCGLDGDDPPMQRMIPLMIGDRIDCPQCRALIFAAKEFRPRDFAREESTLTPAEGKTP